MERILFVYNADSGLRAWFADGMVKVFTPLRYPCNLCKITFGLLLMKKKWKRYTRGLPFHVEFLHRNEFLARYDSQDQLPAIFRANGELSVLLAAEEINGARTPDELIAMMDANLG